MAKNKYFETPTQFLNALKSYAQESEVSLREILSKGSYVDLVYHRGLADEYASAVREDPTLLEKENLLQWLRSAPAEDFIFPDQILLILAPEFLSSVGSLSRRAGVYSFWSELDTPLYVGTSVDLASRIVSSFTERFRHFSDVVYLRYIVTKTSSDAAVCEVAYIAKLKPALNAASKRGDPLTLDITLPEFGPKIQCNLPGEKVWVANTWGSPTVGCYVTADVAKELVQPEVKFLKSQ